MAIVTAEQVMQRFERELGTPLARYPADPSFYPDVNCEWLAVPVADDDPLDVDELFPAFEVYVFASSDDQVMVINDDETPLEEDGAHDGVYWFWDDNPGGGQWVAFTNYPDNLQLVWYSGPERGLGPQWERLDGVMNDLALGREA